METDFFSELKCIVHKEIAETSYLTECCNKLICSKCYKSLQEKIN